MRKKIVFILSILLIVMGLVGCNRVSKANMQGTGKEMAASDKTITAVSDGITKEAETDQIAIVINTEELKTESVPDGASKEYADPMKTEAQGENSSSPSAEERNQPPTEALEEELVNKPADAPLEEQDQPGEAQTVAPEPGFKDEIGSNKDATDGGNCPYALYVITTRVYYDTKGNTRIMEGFYQAGPYTSNESIDTEDILLKQYGLTYKDHKKFNAWGLPVGTYSDIGLLYFVYYDIY